MSGPISTSTLHVSRTQVISDDSGVLMVAEGGRHVPFPIRRTFVVAGVAPGVKRGHHAHRECHQLLICLGGRISVSVSDGGAPRIFTLERLGDCLHIPPGLWAEQVYEEPGTILMVLCDQPYDEGDYLREFDQFLAWRAALPKEA
ncbi:conserved protein of unknown function （RmlC-like cupin domain&|uniref:sugar 3,4-ketoisomerase n=1 Tax=Magnetospirillum sp. XM-1 TaxID=1663591 RepID=UPI00073E03C6|nr:FdtA/QdtA family cupin domain-containing protein [Magnetospirillum sp. XM-1]CUW37985.1 conserved protein of unknown function \